MSQAYEIEITEPATGVLYTFVLDENLRPVEVLRKNQAERVHSICAPYDIPDRVMEAFRAYRKTLAQ